MTCPLCSEAKNLIKIEGPSNKDYFHCAQCDLIFLDRKYLLSRVEEEKRYRLHNNGPDQSGHVTFLKRAIQPVLSHFTENTRVLDFGSGPVPTLSVILRQEYGLACDIYDPLFYLKLPSGTYDFIFAIECFEHFSFPAKELELLESLLAPNGFLIIMTEPWTSLDAFKNWHYPRDPTHISFYNHRSFQYMCDQFQFDCLPCEDSRVFILKASLDVPT